MNDGYVWWMVLAGIGIAFAIAWLLLVRLPRAEDDVSDDERPAEAAWISQTIERFGGVAPDALVEEVLELHQVYLADPRLAREPPVVGQAGALVPGSNLDLPPAPPSTTQPVAGVAGPRQPPANPVAPDSRQPYRAAPPDSRKPSRAVPPDLGRAPVGESGRPSIAGPTAAPPSPTGTPRGP